MFLGVSLRNALYKFPTPNIARVSLRKFDRIGRKKTKAAKLLSGGSFHFSGVNGRVPKVICFRVLGQCFEERLCPFWLFQSPHFHKCQSGCGHTETPGEKRGGMERETQAGEKVGGG